MRVNIPVKDTSMLNSIADVVKLTLYETATTKKLFAALTENIMQQPKIANVNTIGSIAWHIIRGRIRLLKRMGLNLNGMAEPASNGSVEELRTLYNTVTDTELSEIPKVWTDESLTETVRIFGSMDVPRDYALYLNFRHEIHHRAQITTLLRIQGIEPPGLSGPAQSEWEKAGIPEPQF